MIQASNHDGSITWAYISVAIQIFSCCSQILLDASLPTINRCWICTRTSSRFCSSATWFGTTSPQRPLSVSSMLQSCWRASRPTCCSCMYMEMFWQWHKQNYVFKIVEIRNGWIARNLYVYRPLLFTWMSPLKISICTY